MKYFTILYSASYGQNVFFSSGGTDYFTIYDPAPVTPFRTLTVSTKGNNNGNCNDEPLIVGASTGGLSASADGFNSGYRLFLSTFTTFYPSEYEGELIPSEYVPPTPEPFAGTVDCFGEDLQYMLIYQAGNDGAATLTYESLARATWEYGLLPDTPYAIVVSCGGALVNSYETAIPSSTSGDWVCDPYTIRYDQPYCVLS